MTYTSDYFQQLYDIGERMIANGNAYADDTDPEAQREERRNRLPSKRRDRPPEQSLAIFKEMKNGTDLGKKHCLRARITFDSPNGAMRDPVMYRFPNFAAKEDGQPAEPAPHHRTCWTWNVYPTYDFACPVVDSIEGVTHALRTTSTQTATPNTNGSSPPSTSNPSNSGTSPASTSPAPSSPSASSPTSSTPAP